MKRILFLIAILSSPAFAVGQMEIPSIPGNTSPGNTSPGSNYPSYNGNNNSNTSGGSAAPSTGMATDPTSLESAGDLATFQGFQTPGNSTFIGVPNSSTFIGTQQSFDPSKSTSSRRSTTATSTTRRTTTTSRMTTSRMNTMNRNTRTTNDQRSVRPQTSTDFEFAPVSVSAQTREIQTRLGKIPNLRTASDAIAVRMEGDTLTLTGTVATARDRKLAELLVRLEPGVDNVDNRLVVKE